MHSSVKYAKMIKALLNQLKNVRIGHLSIKFYTIFAVNRMCEHDARSK